MAGIKNLIMKRRGSETKAKILEESKLKQSIFMETKNIFKFFFFFLLVLMESQVSRLYY